MEEPIETPIPNPKSSKALPLLSSQAHYWKLMQLPVSARFKGVTRARLPKRCRPPGTGIFHALLSTGPRMGSRTARSFFI